MKTALLLWLMAVTAQAADGIWTIRLEAGAPWQSVSGELKRFPLELTVTVRGGQADAEAWGWVAEQPGLEHPGQVERGSFSDRQARMIVALNIRHGRLDGLAVGGSVRYEITLDRQADGWRGAYRLAARDANNPATWQALARARGLGVNPQARGEERWRDTIERRLAWFVPTTELAGNATAQLGPLPARESPGAAAPGHPRLFFRKEDLPALRAKAATPAGQQILARLRELSQDAVERGFGRDGVDANMSAVWAAGEGLLFQLEADRVRAQRAQDWCLKAMYRVYPDGQSWAHSYSVLGLALAYDFCHEAWPPEFRDRAYAWLYGNVRKFAAWDVDFDALPTARYGFAGNSYGFSGVADARGQRYRAAGALAALAIRGDPPPVAKPVPLDEAIVIAPDTEFVATPGTPVLPLVAGKMSELWLMNGPFRRGAVADPLAAVGGWARARPVDGTAVEHDGVTVEFRMYHPAGTDCCGAEGPRAGLYPRECLGYWYGSYYPGETLREKWQAAGQPFETDLALYTVIENDQPRLVMAKPNWDYTGTGAQMWVNGREVRDGDLLRLAAGTYHVMCRVPVTGGYAVQAPHFAEYGPAEHARAVERWEWAQRGLAGPGSADSMGQAATMLRRSVLRYVDRFIGPSGSGGWGSRHQQVFKHGYGRPERGIQSTLFPMLLAHRHLTGENLATGTGLAQAVPAALRWRGFDRTQHEVLLLGQALMPREHRPLANWYWQEEGFNIHRPFEGVLAFLGLDPAVPAAHPKDALALAQYCPGHGEWLLPSGWDGANGYLVTVNASPLPMSAPGGAGNFCIYGRGREWTERRDPSYGPIDSYMLNVAFSGAGVATGGGKVLHQELFAQGGGIVSVLSELFRRARPASARKVEGRPPEIGGPGQGIELLDGPAPPMSILRSVAVDYSGVCGMPALVVVADKISGLTTDEWKAWHLFVSHMGQVGDKRFTSDPDRASFTIKQGTGRNRRQPLDDIGLRFTMAWPANAELSWFNPRVDGGFQPVVHCWVDRPLDKLEQVRRSGLDKTPDLTGKAKRPGDQQVDDLLEDIARTAPATKPQDCIFVAVFSLGPGKQPQVQVVPGAAQPTVRIGRRVATFTGERLLLSESPGTASP